MKEFEKHICMISDDNYVMPTCVAIQSLIETNTNNISYCVHIIASELSNETNEIFKRLECKNLKIDIIEVNASETFNNYHKFDDKSICVASISSLFKFMIADILSYLDKVLYLDGDIIIKSAIDDVFDVNVDNYYAAAVIDSGSIYYKHKYVQMVKNYFNSGVMLLNLKKIREDNITTILCNKKKELNDTSLMDQNVFNLIFDNKVYLLPVKYNFMPVSLERSKEKWTIDDINNVYNAKYKNKREFYKDAVIIHYSSKDKPWKNLDGVYSSEWISIYLKTPIKHSLINWNLNNKDTCSISVIMPCFNVEKYIINTLNSVIKQTFKDIEIICIDDGSTDNTLKLLKEYEKKYKNIKVFSNKNYKQGYERNFGLKYAKGKYIYYMDSDDILELNCFEILYKNMEENNLDLLFFEGSSFYETLILEKKFPEYQKLYQRKEVYPKIYLGKDLYVLFRNNADFIVSPCLQIVKKDFLIKYNIKFPEITMLEDNLYTFKVILAANRVKCISDSLFKRRVREKSTMTSNQDIEKILSTISIINEMVEVCIKYRNDKDLYTVIFKHILVFLKNIDMFYKNIEKEEQDKLLNSLSNNELNLLMISISLNLILRPNNISKMSQKNVEDSYSYKIGRKITFFPRKIRGTFRYYKTYGLIYTLKRIKKEIKKYM